MHSVPPIDPHRLAIIQAYGAKLRELQPLGATVSDLDLEATAPPAKVVEALEQTMAERGFIVFERDTPLSVDAFLRASCWWGGKTLHSTHSVHPATPHGNPHVFRLSNDSREGILGVGPQWHNDGSFNADTFSHAGYHMVRAPERGGGTLFAHQGVAFAALAPQQQRYWRRLSSVNATSGIVHPLVHRHPRSGCLSVWLHLGMTGGVIEALPDGEGFRLLSAAELTQLCRQYSALLDAGLQSGYAIEYEYASNDCLFIDNLAVAHRAAPAAHKSASEQGLRIMHRSTVRGVSVLKPDFGLPMHLDIYAPSPLGAGVWQAGGLGFRWDEQARMQN
ncbi:MAG: taurine dioxygenase [Proteobacteria bacterium]|nr:taurine dioxygenase [Pseudomonadota bacterium]